MPRVFVVCEPLGRFDPATGRRQAGTDLSPAATFGPVDNLLSSRGPHGSLPDDPQEIADMLRARLDAVGFLNGDYLILLGDMIACAVATSLAAEIGDGSVRLLRWAGPSRGYIPFTLRLWEPVDDPLDYAKDEI